MGATPKKFKPLPPQVREAFERGDGKALARMRAAGHKTLAEKQGKILAERELIAIANQRDARRRELEELNRRKQANEHILPHDTDMEVPEEEVTPEEEPMAPPMAATVPPPQTSEQELDAVYASFARKPKPLTPEQVAKESLQNQISANEVLINPQTHQLEPLSPAPPVDD